MDDTVWKNLKTAVFGKQQVLGSVYEKYGNQTVAEYVNNWNVPAVAVDSAAKDSFFAAISALAGQLYGTDEARKITEQLKQQLLVSTIDHHGILNHPIFVNANLFYSLRPAEYLVCLPTAGVSLNNNTCWSACLLTSGDAGLQRFSFFPDKLKTQVCWTAPAIIQQHVEKVKAAISRSTLPSNQQNTAQQLLQDVIPSSVLTMKNFSEQASVISNRLWSKLFPKSPKLVYLPVEDITIHMLTRLAQAPGSVLHRLLFTQEGWLLLEKYFQGSLGAFISSHKGSFLFWGVDSKGRRIHLQRQGNMLVGEGCRLELTYDAMQQGFSARTLYPTTLLCCMALLLAGVNCLGGFNQVNWLTNIKQKFVALLHEAGEPGFAVSMESVETQNFSEANLAFLKKKEGFFSPTGVDIYMQQDPSLYEQYHAFSNSLTLGESLESMLPEIYRVITPSPERDPVLLGLTEQEILQHNGTHEKMARMRI